MKHIMLLFILLLTTVVLQAQTVQQLSSQLDLYQNVRDFCLSADGKEAYFSIQSPNQDLSQLVCVKNKAWNRPELLPFCDGYKYLEPFLSPDGLRLYFASDRPKSEEKTMKSDFDIWYVERKDKKSAWSAPINAGDNVNSENDEFYPSLAANNNLYLTISAPSGIGKDDIYYCKWDGKAYSKPILLSEKINSKGYEFNAFIAQDESYLIYSKYKTKDGFGSGDLYLAKKDENGEWLEAENLGKKINSKYMDYCPFYDAKNKRLYFTSRRNQLEAKQFKDLKSYQAYISSGLNGWSKLYQCKLELE